MEEKLGMKRALVICLFLLTAVIMTVSPAAAVGSYGVNLDSEAYHSENPYKSYEGECTWYAWGRVYEKLGISLYWRTQDGRLGNAKEWLSCAQNYDYQCGTEPRANSVIVWTGGEYGHVAFLESIGSDGSLYISESNRIDHAYSEGVIDPSSWWYYGPSSDYRITAPAGYIYFDTTPPTISTLARVSNVTRDGFTITFEASDESGIAQVYADVRPGSPSAGACRFDGAMSGSTATVNVETALVNALTGSASNHYYVTCYVSDTVGNWAELHVEHERISLYPVKVYTGTFEAMQDTAVHSEPCEEIDGTPTERYILPRGTCISGVGYYTNEWGAMYMLAADGGWIYGDHLRRRMQWSDIWETIFPFLQQNTEEIFYFAGQALEVPCLRSGSRAADRSGGNEYITIYGNVITGTTSQTSSYVETHTVYFDACGGSVSTGWKTVAYNAPYGHLPTPYRLGYRFDGWFTLSEGGELIRSSDLYTLHTDRTLYAQWTRIVLLNQVPCGDNLYVTLYGDGEMIITGYGEMTSCPWTERYAEYVVTAALPEGMTAFCPGAFSGCTYLRTINIPDVETIPESCFRGCRSLEAVDLPETVVSLKNYAFADSGTDFALPKGLLSLGHHILDGNTGVTSVTVPVTLIQTDDNNNYGYGYGADPTDNPERFYGPFTGSAVRTAVVEEGTVKLPDSLFARAERLESVTLPETLTEIGRYAFYGTSALRGIELPQALLAIRRGAFAVSGLEALSLPNGLITLGEYLLYRTDGVKTILLPNTINETPEPEYWSEPGPFCGSGLETAELEAGSTRVYPFTFNGCRRLETATLPDTVTSIEVSAFAYCGALTAINLPESVTILGDSVFAYCTSLVSLDLPDSVTSIGAYAFQYSGLASLELPASLQTLGYRILSGNTGVTSINIPAALIRADGSAAYADSEPDDDGYTSPGNNPQYQYGPFTGSAVKEAEVESGMLILPDHLFIHALQLESVTLPETLTEIGRWAFYGTPALREIELPESLRAIRRGAFAFSGLESLTLPNGLITLGEYLLFYTEGVKTILLPNTINETTDPEYWQHPGPFYRSGLETAELETGSTRVYPHTFYGCPCLTAVSLPDTVTAVMDYAFACSEKLDTVNIPGNVTVLGDYVFDGCAGLTALEIPNSVTSIGYCAFRNSGLTSLKLPAYLLTLGSRILDGNTQVTEITIPSTLSTADGSAMWAESEPNDDYTSVGNNPEYQYGPFTGSAVKTAVVESGMRTLPDNLFIHAKQLESLTLPETLTEIGWWALYGTEALETLELPGLLRTVGRGSFAFSGVKEILLPDTLVSLGEYAFMGAKGLQKVRCSDRLAVIPDSVFKMCLSLEAFTAGAAVTEIRDSAFMGCAAMAEFTWDGPAEKLGRFAFRDCDSLAAVHLNAPLPLVEAGAFYDCDALQTVILPDTVTELEDHAFYGCNLLEDCPLPPCLESIGAWAFADCDALKTLTVPKSVNTLGDYAYYDCDTLQTMTLSTMLTCIPEYCFAHCDTLEAAVIPLHVTRIRDYAFHQCVSLTSLTVPQALEDVGTEAFSYIDRMIVYGVAGTYGETWAENNHFRFVDRQIHAEAAELSDTTLTVSLGRKARLDMTVTPADFTDAVVWKSSDPDVAAVDAFGTVVGLSLGTAVIRLMVGDSVGASCTVRVCQPVSSITLAGDYDTVEAMDRFPITALVYPDTAENDAVTWSSSDPSIASVDETGMVSAWSKGTAFITAAAADGSDVSAVYAVTVNNTVHMASAPEEFASPHSYPANCSDLWVYTSAGAEKLTVTFSAETAMEPGFDSLQLYDGKKNRIGTYTGTELAGQSVEIPGDTVILRLVSDASGSAYGFSVSSIVPYVFQPVPAKGISFRNEAITMQKDSRTTLYPVFDPVDTTDQEVQWSSSDPKRVSVSRNGVITALAEGTAVITAVSEDGGFSASVTVRVTGTSALGDVNEDGSADAGDAMRILQSIVGLIRLTETERAAADVNGDGCIDAGDAVLILRYDAGLLAAFPGESRGAEA